MKLLVIPDLHGNDIWKYIVEQEQKKVDKIVFLGDYVDSYHYSDEIILKNLRNIITYKLRNPKKVELLIGNHDIQYVYSHNEYGCSGYRPVMYNNLHDLYNKYFNLFKIAYQYENTILSHAGLTIKFYNSYLKQYELIFKETPIFENIADNLNAALTNKSLFEICAYISKIRGGYDPFAGIFWADMAELEVFQLKEFKQIVGHTSIKKKETIDNVTFIDTYGRGNYEHYIFEL